LRLEGFHEATNLLLIDFPFEWDEEIWLPHISVVFWDFVFEDQVIPERIPSHLLYQPMILMCVIAIVCKNQVRGGSLQTLKETLDLGSVERKEAVAKILDKDLLSPGGFQKQLGTVTSFLLALFVGTKNNPDDFQIGVSREQTQNSPAAPNLDIVGV